MPYTDQLVIMYAGDIHVETAIPPIEAQFGDNPGDRAYYGHVNSLPNLINKSNSVGPDLAVMNGDIVNGGLRGTGERRALNFQEYVSYMDGSQANDAIVAPVLHSIGHWDVDPNSETSATAADYTQFWDATDGVGSLSGPPKNNLWWPLVATDDTPCAYTTDIKGWRIVVMATVHGEIDPTTDGQYAAGGATKTQQEWLDEVALVTALPIIVVSHQPIQQILGATPNNEGVMASLEALPQDVFVLEAHTHNKTGVTEIEGVNYIGIVGDILGETENDLTRYANAIITFGDIGQGLPKVRVERFRSSPDLISGDIDYNNDNYLVA